MTRAWLLAVRHFVDIFLLPRRAELRPPGFPAWAAINIAMQSFTDESGRYLPLEELAAMHEGDRNQRHITYCGGGIAASSSAFIMTRLGFTDVAVYTASLQEWAADSANPTDTGSQ